MIKKMIVACTTLILICRIIFCAVHMQDKGKSSSINEIKESSTEEIRETFEKYNEKEKMTIKSGEIKEGVMILKWSKFPYCTEYEVEYANDSQIDFGSTTVTVGSSSKKEVSQIRIPASVFKYQGEMDYFKVRPCVRFVNEQGEEELLTGNWSELLGVNSY